MEEYLKSEIFYIYTFECQNTHSVKLYVTISKKLLNFVRGNDHIKTFIIALNIIIIVEFFLRCE